MQSDTVTVLGAGSWGTALAYLLAGKGLRVTLWDRDGELASEIDARKLNPKYLPNTPLGDLVHATANMQEAVSGARWIIVAVSSDGVRGVISDAEPYISPDAIIISACKGLEAETGFTTSEIIETLLSDVAFAGLAVMSGPNLAVELVREVPTATIVASLDPDIARAAQSLLMTDRTFRVYTQYDVKGVELGGALKNVLAIGAGISDGLGYGDNTKAALMSRGLLEMTQLGVATGGQALTFLGLAGVGDLMATTVSRLSRNYRVGLGLSERIPIQKILQDLKQAAEGVPTAQAARVLGHRYGVETPVLSAIHSVIHNGKSPLLAVDELMSRSAKDEFTA